MDRWVDRHGGVKQPERAPRAFARYCFRMPEDADRFQRAFAGERIDVLPTDPVLKTLRRQR